MEAFAKANDERDFYLDRKEGFLIYVDLDKAQEEINALYDELEGNHDRYVQIPKMTFYETKKIMEGFVNEKVYDIDTKEKLLDIIQSKEARENFLEFVYDHHSEFEKWQQYYQERSRIRIIEWLRNNHYHFVFEEDLDLAKGIVEKLKMHLFQAKAPKEVLAARKSLITKAKTYYSNEALNPRPKRGRPPKQAIKLEVEPQMTSDFYLTVSPTVRPFLFTPEHTTSTAFTFSSKFETEEDLLANRKLQAGSERAISIEDFNSKLASLRNLSNNWVKPDEGPKKLLNGDFGEESLFEEDEDEEIPQPKKSSKKKTPPAPAKKASPPKKAAPAPAPAAKTTPRRIIPKKRLVTKSQQPSKKPRR